MRLCFALIGALLFFPALLQADPLDEPCWSDPDTPCLLIGVDPEDVRTGRIQPLFVPPIDHHFRVVDIFWVTTIEMGVEYRDCFVQVEVVETPATVRSGADSRGRPYVEDFDNAFKPMDEIPVDLETCSSPLFVPESERNLP
jgi:hypothetical protein